jgi:hypothetical protein
MSRQVTIIKVDGKTVIRSCATCGHRGGSGEYAKCYLSGYFCDVERMYSGVCGREFDGWKPRLGIIQRVKRWWSNE